MEGFAQPPEHRNAPLPWSLNCFRSSIFKFRQSISFRILPPPPCHPLIKDVHSIDGIYIVFALYLLTLHYTAQHYDVLVAKFGMYSTAAAGSPGTDPT